MNYWESPITFIILFAQTGLLVALYCTTKSKVFLVVTSFLILYSLSPVVYDYIFSLQSASYYVEQQERYEIGLLISAIISVCYMAIFNNKIYVAFFVYFLALKFAPFGILPELLKSSAFSGNIPMDAVYYSVAYALECMLILWCVWHGIRTAFGTFDLGNYHIKSWGMARAS